MISRPSAAVAQRGSKDATDTVTSLKVLWLGVLCFVRPSSSDFCPGRALGRCLKIAHVPQPPQRTPPLRPATRLPKQTASNTRTMVPDGKPRRPRTRAHNQARSVLPGEPALSQTRSRQRRCFIRGARVALALSSITSLFQTGQPKKHPEDHEDAIHCDALRERSLAAPQPATTAFADTKRSRSNI